MTVETTSNWWIVGPALLVVFAGAYWWIDAADSERSESERAQSSSETPESHGTTANGSPGAVGSQKSPSAASSKNTESGGNTVENSYETLTIGGETIDFGAPVEDVVRTDDRVIVRHKPDEDVSVDRNVIGYSDDGRKLWRIEAMDFDRDAPYMNLTLRGDELWAHNWTGYACHIDLDTGEILEKKFTK